MPIELRDRHALLEAFAAPSLRYDHWLVRIDSYVGVQLLVSPYYVVLQVDDGGVEERVCCWFLFRP